MWQITKAIGAWFGHIVSDIDLLLYLVREMYLHTK